jgi:hypothetical protein|tara:strand:+ start:289 stop:471 length:183 start_codon:yes stop_codon:yes gene_type:complete
MKGNNMSKDIETNMNYRDLVSKVDRLQCDLSFLIEDADLLREKFGRLQRVIDDSIKPKKG